MTWGRKVAGGGRLRTGQGRAQRGAYWAVGRMWFTAQRREQSCWPGVGFLGEVKGVWRGMGVGGVTWGLGVEWGQLVGQGAAMRASGSGECDWKRLLNLGLGLQEGSRAPGWRVRWGLSWLG